MTYAQTVPWKDLVAKLPDKVEGYTGEEPSGTDMTMGGMSYSMATREYKGAEGSSDITVSIMDYAASKPMFDSLLNASKQPMKMEGTDIVLKSFDYGIPGSFAYETVDKGNKSASVIVGVYNRFILMVIHNGATDSTLARKVATGIDLKSLAH